MKIYLASSWKQAANVMTLKHMLEGHGHQVDAFCDTESGKRYVFSFDKLAVHTGALTNMNIRELPEVRRAFNEDKKWLDWAEACLLVLPSGKSAHLEAGYTKGRGKPLVIYQPEFPTGDFDVMYGFADLITDDTGQIVEFFSRIGNRVKDRSEVMKKLNHLEIVEDESDGESAEVWIADTIENRAVMKAVGASMDELVTEEGLIELSRVAFDLTDAVYWDGQRFLTAEDLIQLNVLQSQEIEHLTGSNELTVIERPGVDDALKFYAEKANWAANGYYWGERGPAYEDRGLKAREVLENEAKKIESDRIDLIHTNFWEPYVQDSVHEGKWVVIWTKDGEEPVFAQYIEDCTEDCGVDGPGFVNEDGWAVPVACVSHIMYIKPPDGKNSYWE